MLADQTRRNTDNPSEIGELPDEQQRVGRMTRPASLGNQNIKPERRKIIRKRIDLHVLGLVQHLCVRVALVAGLSLDRTGIAFDPFQRERARAASR